MKRVSQLGQRVRAVAHTQPPAHGQLPVELGRQYPGRHKSHLASIQPLLGLFQAIARGDAEFGKHLRRRDALRIGQRAMHQHRQAFACQQQRQQWRQVCLPPGAVVAGNHDRHGLVFWCLQLRNTCLHRLMETQHFGF